MSNDKVVCVMEPNQNGSESAFHAEHRVACDHDDVRRNRDEREDVHAGRRRLWTIIASAVLSLGVVASEHVRHGAGGGLVRDPSHGIIDGLLALPLAYCAVWSARRISRWGSRNRGSRRQTLVQAAATSVLFGLLLVPAVGVHEHLDTVLARSEPGMAERGGTPAVLDHEHPAAAPHAGALSHGVAHGARVAWTGLPLAILAVALLRRGDRATTARLRLSVDCRSGSPPRQRTTPVGSRRGTAHEHRPLWRVAAAVGVCVGVVADTGHRVSAGATPEAKALATGCAEIGAVVPLAYERVRPHVPPQFALSAVAGGRLTGQADVFVRAYRCDQQTVGPHTVVDTTTVTFGVFIDDREGRPAVYTFFYITDNPHLVSRMKEGTGMERIFYVPDLEMRRDAVGPAGSRYTVVAPAPSPSTFHITAVSSAGVPPGGGLTGRWWSELPRSSANKPSYLRFLNSIPAFRPAGGVAEINVQPGSFMAEVLGSAQVTAYSVGGELDTQETSWAVMSSPPTPRI